MVRLSNIEIECVTLPNASLQFASIFPVENICELEDLSKRRTDIHFEEMQLRTMNSANTTETYKVLV